MSMRNFLIITTILASLAPGHMVSAADGQSAVELRLQFAPSMEASPPPAEGARGPFLSQSPVRHRIQIAQRRHLPGPPPRQRRPELSSEQLVVVGLDGEGRELTRRIVADPRLIRAETVDSSGKLSSQILYRQSTDLTITLPDDPDMAALRIYHPRWTGKEFVLEPLGETPLP